MTCLLNNIFICSNPPGLFNELKDIPRPTKVQKGHWPFLLLFFSVQFSFYQFFLPFVFFCFLLFHFLVFRFTNVVFVICFLLFYFLVLAILAFVFNFLFFRARAILLVFEKMYSCLFPNCTRNHVITNKQLEIGLLQLSHHVTYFS